MAQIQAAVAPAKFTVPSIYSSPATYKAPKDGEWSFEIERELGSHDAIIATYTGNHGYNLAETVDANMFMSSKGISNYGGAYAGLPLTAPDPRFLGVTQYYNNGLSNYNALTIQYRFRSAYGFSGQIHYTYSHSLGTVAFENPFNTSTGYGSLGFDNRHQVAGDVLWSQDHKFGNRGVNALASGWIVGAKVYVYSGAPFSVTDSKIPAQINSSLSAVSGGVITPLADLLTPSAVNANCGSGAVNKQCLTTSEFATYILGQTSQPIQADWGNISPNSFRGPGYFDIDAQISRDFKFKERMNLTLGLQAYNVMNHPNFANPSGSLSSSSFGLITTTLGPPTSIYGTGQGASVSGRVAVLTGRFTF